MPGSIKIAGVRFVHMHPGNKANEADTHDIYDEEKIFMYMVKIRVRLADRRDC